MTIIITGAAGSLGSALSLECARIGLNTVMVDRDLRSLESVYDRISDAGFAEPVIHPMDLASAGPDDYGELLSAVHSEFGGLDALVHCAARFEGLTPVDQIAPEEWLNSIQVNLNAAWLLSAQSLPLLKESRAGRLYFLLDDLSRVEGPFWGAYGVSKHALKALALQFAAESKKSVVQVLGIDPGPMRSALRSKAYHSENPEDQPAPQIAALQVLAFLTGENSPGKTLVDLKPA